MSHRPNGWVYAVRRECAAEAPSCAKLCADPKLRVQDTQTAKITTWKCIGAMHVYFNRPATGDGSTPRLGLKQAYYGYGACGRGGTCGPNYCCCVPS